MSQQKPIRFQISSPFIGAEEKRNVLNALESGWLSHRSPLIAEFENACTFLGGKNRVAVANGTVAIEILLRAAGIGPGDEVITSGLTYAASANAILHAGAIPVLADIDPLTWQIDADLIEGLATEKTKAILAVSLFGNVPPIDSLEALCAKHGWKLFFDNAESHGAKYKGKYLGDYGLGSTSSFYANKLVAAGEGGIVTTNSKAISSKIRHLINAAQVIGRDFYHDELGWNYRMTALSSAVALGQIARLDSTLAHHENLLTRYKFELSDLTCQGQVTWMESLPDAEPVTWLVAMRLKLQPGQLNSIRGILRDQGIETRPFFVPLSQLPYLPKSNTPVADRVSESGICLPTHMGISPDDVIIISNALKSAIQEVTAP
jgi:perosamine synthetase